MTQNQIEFSKAMEQSRHNLATETETNRNNVAVLSETNRHNVATEGEAIRSNKAKEKQARRELRETTRHNKAGEKETRRHNKKGESQNLISLKETNRHNLATEAETARSNQAKEANDRYSTDMSYQSSVDSAAINAAGRIQSAAISAEASKYAADVGNMNTRLHEMAENARSADRNATSKQIQEMKDATTKAEGYATRLQNAILSGDKTNVDKQRVAIDKFRAEIDRKYKQGDISLRQSKQLKEVLDSLINSSLKAGETISKTRR